jgi:phosphatidylglycerol:prolipoprotein diacylglycerol transferase
MKNELISIGPITIYGYGLMIAIGVISAFLVADKRAQKMNLDENKLLNIAIWAVIGGILGAKFLYIVTQIKEIISDPKSILDVTRGFVVYGGIIGGIIAGVLYCKKAKINSMQYFDLIMPSVALAQGFGRIGCFLAGCCYGIETTSRFAVVFHESDFAPNGIRLLPAQLISSGLNFIHFIVLILIARRSNKEGQVAGFYLIFYSLGRFVLEFFRGDLARGSIGTLSTSQFISIFVFIIGLVFVFRKKVADTD